MKNTKYAHQIPIYVIHHDVILVDDQLSGSSNAAWATHAGMNNQATRTFCKQFIKSQRGNRIVLCYVIANFPSIINGQRRPNQPHDAESASFRRVSNRQAVASASTFSASTKLPSRAESKPD